jgi:hypothetical protein
VTVRLVASLVAEVDAFAQEHGVSRTSAVSHLLTFALRGWKPMSEKEKEVLRGRAKRRGK